MKQVVLDTETTGLEVSKGHRIIEIGCVELVNRRQTGKIFHRLVQPDRDIDPGAEDVHGISKEKLADASRFPEIAAEFVEFISGAELIIHNAGFDVGFLENEFRLAELEPRDIAGICAIVDTLALARQLHPGQRNSLDALCKRYHVDNSGREFHGALLDAQLLTDVYLAMTGGQGALSLEADGGRQSENASAHARVERNGPALTVIRATEDELAAHQMQLDLIDQASTDGALWKKIET
jgi:DNA polymerase-3 subunit epsilon